MAKYLLFFAIVIALTMCGILYEMWPGKLSANITDVQQEYLDSVTVSRSTHTVRVRITGQLTDSVKIVWAPSRKSLFNSSTTSSMYSSRVLTKGKVDIDFRQDYYSQKLYFRYFPYNSNTKGNLKAQIMLF